MTNLTKMMYVGGFVFTPDLQNVLLIKKNRPPTQLGLWNGVGGKIEKDETPFDAMHREFEEEVGIKDLSWTQFCVQTNEKFIVYWFKTIGDFPILWANKNKEELKWFSMPGFYAASDARKLVSNVAYLVPMAKAIKKDDTLTILEKN